MDSKTSGPPRADAQQTDFYVVIPWPVYQLGAHASHVYGALRKRADEQMRCWPSHRRIAADSGLSVRTVQACLATLREEGWIDWEQRKSGDGKNPNTSNIYRVYGSARARRGAQEMPTGTHHVPTPGTHHVPTGAQEMPSELRSTELVTTTELSTSRPSPDDVPSDDVIRLAQTLSALLTELGVKHEVVKAWHRDLRLMITKDGRTPEEIEGAIRWALADDFWGPNIHSPRALRKHYDQMRLQAGRRRNGKQDQTQQGLDLAAYYRSIGE